MFNPTQLGARTRAPIKAFLFLTLGASLASCSYLGYEEAGLSEQDLLIQELDNNQMVWAQSGVSAYSFDIEKDCDCPDEIKSSQKMTIQSDEALEDKEELEAEIDAAAEKVRGKIVAREGSDNNRAQANQSVRMETVFSDLRQAIQQGSVRSVNYDSRYGYPQTVVLNNQFRQSGDDNGSFRVNGSNNGDNRSFNTSADDDGRGFNNGFTVRTNNFQVRRSDDGRQNIPLSGQLIRQDSDDANRVANPYWLVSNDGRWNQLNVSGDLDNQFRGLQNRSFVQLNGQWFPGGASGQGVYIPNQFQVRTDSDDNPFRNNLNGTLYYSVANNTSYDLDDFYVSDDRGRNVFLNVPANLRNQALALSGQRVNLQGNWSTNYLDQNARFSPNAFNSFVANVRSFRGILNRPNTYPVPGVLQNNYLLVDDFGGVQEVEIPANLINNLAYLIGQRVEIQGSNIYSGYYGQQRVYAQSVRPLQNIFTNSVVTGVISTMLSSGGYSNIDQVLLQTDQGTSITVQIPSIYRNPYNTLSAGMRVQVNGAWISSASYGSQGIFEARSPVQIVNYGYSTATTYSGYINNLGASFGGGVSCTGAQNNYSFTTDNGQVLQLYVSNTTRVNGLANGLVNIPYQSRVQVSGTMLSPGVLQANTIDVYQQNNTTIVGTIIEIGAPSGTFTCTGQLLSYRLLDQYGNAYSITVSPSSQVQGSQGTSFLRIGDYVRVTGSSTNNGYGSTFYARQITAISVATPGSALPFPGTIPVTYPNPFTGSLTSFMGTVTGLDCSTGLDETYIFIDQSGALYKLRVNMNLLATGMLIDVGTQLSVTGSLVNNEIVAQQINPIATFADPVNRVPLYGTIMSLTNSVQTTCGFPVNTYQFRTDNGQIMQLRITNEAAMHQPTQFDNGTRLVVVRRVSGANPQIVDALEVQYSPIVGAGLPVNFGVGGQPISVTGTITSVGCTNEYYFVDQNGTGYQLQMNNSSLPSTALLSVGTKLSVTGQILGNRLVATSVYPNTLPVYTPPPPPVSGTITNLINTVTLSCGVTINTYNFQNDNGRVQRLRIGSSVGGLLPGQTATGSRLYISNRIESFDGQVIDALSVSQQSYFY
ncbi:MAG: DUF6174 domain-containing protein [Gammaproteobacteria bacterium]|nr:DUF6174 domain-containing protein [Gammaproteobacteria bacterium]